ncbi:MAG: efflux RND transporter periplasmic adaptor subunit [Opitutaceae bacterium]|nr:efflux RND transporter periplasmic adaptor subunit [Opitutaceae bacterium]
MKLPTTNRRTLALIGVLLPLFGLFAYVAFRSGPLAPVPVTTTTVEQRAINPALHGIGTIEARYTHKIGPTLAGRVKTVHVQVGDRVQAGQLLGEMDPVDIDERINAQEAARKRALAAVQAAEALVQEVKARQVYAEAQARRYESLLRAGSTSEETVEAKKQDLQVVVANLATVGANLEVARQELARIDAERRVLVQQKANLQLLAPTDGLVTVRHADPGTTIVAGQPVVEMIDPQSLWINVRFEQLLARGLRADLPARVVLRSQSDQAVTGRVLRVEPVADTVTEETLAKVVFDTLPAPLPPIGELTEVTVALPALPEAPVVPNASLQRIGGRLGVWLIVDHDLRFAPVTRGAADLDGRVQIREGLAPGARVVVHSMRSLGERTRVKRVEQLPGIAP